MHICVLLALAALGVQGATYYVDSAGGSDSNDGLSPERAWASVGRVNRTKLVGGDSVLFKRGGLWREALAGQSGEEGKPILFSSYGEGALPLIQPSKPVSDPALWEEVSPGLWRTKKATWKGTAPASFSVGDWWLHSEAGAKATLDRQADANGVVTNRIAVQAISQGRAGNHIQLWGPGAPDFKDGMVVRLRARSKRPYTFARICLMDNHSPWTVFANSQIPEKIENEWKEIDLRFVNQGKSIPDTARINIYLGGNVEVGDEIEFQVLGAELGELQGGVPLPVDVGNIIFNHGERCGWKRWEVSDLKSDFEYVYERTEQCVYLRHKGNPGERWKSIEFAQRTHGVSLGCHDTIFDGLAIRYVGSHGFGGGGTARVTIRNCEISYIGGAHQFTRTTAKGPAHVRFGNGIEFWGNARDCLVENNRVWEIYDAALTNQGRGDGKRQMSTQMNITYRNNVIWNSEFSFEYWNAPVNEITKNIRFVHNTCVDAGKGWAHAQRPDPNGAHLMFYSNRATTTDFVITDNVFMSTTEQGMRMDFNWLERSALTLSNNLWWCSGKPLYRLARAEYVGEDKLSEIQSKYSQELGSVIGEAKFMDASKRDYRLAPGSLGTKMASDGGCIGAR